jgi:hypothetical protein
MRRAYRQCSEEVLQTSSSILILRLFSAAVTLEPVAVAPERFETEAVYSPPDSSTLPEYCFPPTVVEYPETSISSAVALLAPPALDEDPDEA